MLLFEIVRSIQLAPDIGAGLRAEAATLGLSVDALIANAVKAYLRNGTCEQKTTPRLS